MDKEELKLIDFSKALLTLEEALKNKSCDPIMTRDASIKRFEYCYELCWKTCKEFIEEKFAIEVFSPKTVFRELRRNQVITDKETEILLQMTKDRNSTTHIYEEKIIKIIYGNLTDYYKIMKKLKEIIFKKIND